MRTEYFCELCNFKSNRKENFTNHLATKKHKNNFYESNEFKCEICQYSTPYQQNLQKHLETTKHKSKVEEKEEKNKKSQQESDLKDQIISTMMTKIDNMNNDLSSIKDTININNSSSSGDTITNANTNTNTNTNTSRSYNTTTTNSHNTFNLQFFLNETCKDAMNITDFVETIVVGIQDLKNLGKNGYVEAISALIIENLNKLDITKRPMHCSDLKRENIYIRTKHNWEKENKEKTNTNQLIRDVQRANTRALQDTYQKEYPNCLTDFKSKEHKEYGEIAYQAFGGKGDCDQLNKKIIRKIVKEIPIDRSIVS